RVIKSRAEEPKTVDARLVLPDEVEVVESRNHLDYDFTGGEAFATPGEPQKAAPAGGSSALQPEPAPAKALPDETQIKVFTLRNAKAGDAARIIDQLFSRELHSVAVDERTNSVIVRGSAGEVLNVIYHIITRLDEAELGRTSQAASVAS